MPSFSLLFLMCLFVLQVVLPSSESVAELQPKMDDILKCPCDGIIVTAAGSAFDFHSRYFAPKFGVDEVKESTYLLLWSDQSIMISSVSSICLFLLYV